MNNQNQTAVQWLIKNLIDEGELMISIRIIELISKAEEMEKNQIKDAYWDGGEYISMNGEDTLMNPEVCEEYYTQTFPSSS